MEKHHSDQLAQAIERIREMEDCFDALLAGSQDPHCLKRLMAYYEGPLWRADFALDEQGLLPKSLKRGVLSEDGVWNLLSQK
ncbi:MAG: DUF4298 domain-containing protein [Clostridia bacterium]|nr:DUF4298 domain-containing protein [Clostridia bacterium]